MTVEIVLHSVFDADIAETAKELSDAGLEVSFAPSANPGAIGRRGPSDYNLWINLASLGLSTISLIVTVIAALRARRPECSITLKVPGENVEANVVQPNELEAILKRLIDNYRSTQDSSE